ncbi:unnamed protein product [Acanthoscelides obtectus]|uniref:Uncharacterized protein n=1 Tax=Acanthoscelides obtectus TaxID=200917 RepID=A0A9P0NTR6_ACAOB|nr:unnamed protein product [Acanthoscelides obtectus]CAK1679011.1 hypothetical protein AOBTE_LOCUS32091 [Acanthoscelides obtectus]
MVGAEAVPGVGAGPVGAAEEESPVREAEQALLQLPRCPQLPRRRRRQEASRGLMTEPIGIIVVVRVSQIQGIVRRRQIIVTGVVQIKVQKRPRPSPGRAVAAQAAARRPPRRRRRRPAAPVQPSCRPPPPPR